VNFAEISAPLDRFVLITALKSFFMKRAIVTILPVVILFAISIQGCGGGQESDTDGRKTDTSKTESGQTPQSSAKEDQKESIDNQVLYQRLEELIATAKQEKCNKFSSFLIYTGDDEKRKFQDKLNMQNQAEKYRAESTCKAIYSWLNESNGYDYGDYRIEGHSVLDSIYRQEVVFTKRAGSNRRVFTFMKDGNEYYLMNIK